MHEAMQRLGTALRRGRGDASAARGTDTNACSWETLRAVYQQQAGHGVPEAIRGLELIEQDRWPSSGQPRSR